MTQVENELTDNEIMENADFYEEIEEKKANHQCWWCGGFYWFDNCNIENDQTKREFIRYKKLQDN